ncbi:DNA recombination protein RmuC [Robiginitalea myxolifaciens]|uniref:DNA recombination protein RmuC n=2 Tax=Robiginitalea myxolifaciens TaxID=400055 RepID=A0A1I6FMP8_9FLAO|nr:DNA recombination protein RmuC [Robiginitalea myxolifaciens]
MGMENIWVILGLALVFGGLGFLVGRLLTRSQFTSQSLVQQERERASEQSQEQLRLELASAREEVTSLREQREIQGQQLIRREGEVAALQEKYQEQKAQLEEVQQRFTKEFENLANKILEEKSLKFTEQNQKNIKTVLEPLQQRIKDFEEKVEKTRKENYGIHEALKEQLRNLQSQNLKISQEAENLTRALKGDSKMQGNWGELVLERVLEKSGLERDREYHVQQSFQRADGTRVLPDVIINLPNGNKMVVDSKVSLTDYERYVNAEEEERAALLKAHVNSIKRHVEQLSAKKYEDLYEMESPDFVLMFVPIETAFTVAVNYDLEIYNTAFAKNIVIVTPSTLLATLRTIDSMWSNEKQRRNALEIARQAGNLYDKFVGFADDLTEVGRKMDSAKKDYEGAMNKLVSGKGNLVSRVETLRSLGAKSKKSLPEPLLKRAERLDEASNALEGESTAKPNKS